MKILKMINYSEDFNYFVHKIYILISHVQYNL